MKKVLFTILFLFATVICYADDISISADVDRQEIAIDEQVTLTITVSGSVSNIPQPAIPNLSGFTAYSSGRSQNISIINGQVNSSVIFTYILVPNEVGDYTLGPFTINYKGQAYSAGPINIKVLPRAIKQPQAPSYTYPQVPAEPEEEPKGEGQKGELFIETYVDKLTAYVNEQITLTFAFYQAVDLFENPVYNPPSTTGFWTEDMPPQKKYYKIINGRRYLVTEIKTALFATSPGAFTIGPARLEASVEDLERFFSRRPFDIFDRNPFSIFRSGKPVILATEPITVEILPLPEEGRQLNFKGDVGRFDITAGMDKGSVEESQPVTLKIVIKGEGNIKTISSPEIPETSNVRIYDSGSSENISKSNYVVQGEKIFEKVIIPKQAGNFTIGPIEYSYFDPVAKRYINKKIDPIAIEAVRSKEAATLEPPLPISGFTKEEVKLLKQDISYIKTGPANLKSKNLFLYKNKIFLVVILLPLILLISLYIYQLHRERLRTDIGYARSRRARGLASKRLKQARNIMLKENVHPVRKSSSASEQGFSNGVKGFYAEIYKAVIEYIADKLNIPHPSITKDLLEEKLKAKGISEEIIGKIKELFGICDMARFASGSFTPLDSEHLTGFTREDMHKTLEEAMDIIAGFDRFI